MGLSVCLSVRLPFRRYNVWVLCEHNSSYSRSVVVGSSHWFVGSLSLVLILLCITIILMIASCIVQLVTCLATDACMTADPGIVSSIPTRSQTFVEIDHEIISTAILLPSAKLIIQEGLLSVTS